MLCQHFSRTGILGSRMYLQSAKTVRSFTVVSHPDDNKIKKAHTIVGHNVDPDDMPFHHFLKHSENRGPKFQSPRKRASKIFAEINQKECEKNVSNRPNVLQVPFRPGDAIEITMVAQGGVNSKELEKVRGVVLGKVNRGLGSSVDLRDVVFGEPIDRKILLHSPLLRSIKVLEENFVFKGRRKVKRAKLYYLRDRLPEETRVTKW